MDDSTDLDLAIAVALAESNESLTDDDFKPSSRKVGFNQQLAFNACRIPKKKQQLHPKKKLDKKEVESNNDLVGDVSGDGGRQKKVRKLVARDETIPRMNSIVSDSINRITSRSMEKLESFRYTGGRLGAAHAVHEAVPIIEHEMKPLEVSPVKTKSQTEIPNPDQSAENNVCRSDFAADHREQCLVIDIDTDEVVELCDETQFSVLLRLCGEECEQGESRTDVDRIPLLAGATLENSVSTLDEQTTSVINRVRLPGRDSGEVHKSTGMDDVLTNFEVSLPKIITVESTITPSINIDDTHRPVIQEGTCAERQSSQDQFCEDAISSMMTQQCVSQPEEGKPVHRISPSPLRNISNLPPTVDTNKQWSMVKSTDQAATSIKHSESMNMEDALGKKGTEQLRRPVLEVHQMDCSREGICQDKGIIGDSPCDVIVVEHLSVCGNAMEHSPVHTGHKTIVEDVLLYSEEVSEIMQCPICGENINGITVEERSAHTNSCLDKLDTVQEGCPQDEGHRKEPSLVQAADEVKDWLDKLNLSRYVSLFVEQEIDWDTLPWLTEKDLLLMGITAIGPRRKIFLAIQELKLGSGGGRTQSQNEAAALGTSVGNASTIQIRTPTAGGICSVPQANGGERSNLITNYFPLPPESEREQSHEKPAMDIVQRTGVVKNKTSKLRRTSIYQNPSGIPAWMCIPGTPFRVDAFQHLSGDCSYWFLTHFHTDHYQGLTRAFRYGHIFCSSITARLVNLSIGVSWEKLMIIPLDEKVKIAGVDVTFIDANHCPGSVMILFEPPNGEAVLHTGDFRFCTEMANNCLFQTTKIHTLVLDTTFCDVQYDFPPQDTVIRFVIDAIQAEMFNADTLFLIGTYKIGKERIFLEVGKVLKKYVYVGAPKKKLLDCMDLSADDTKWLTCNEHESFIHVVPLWSISSFKRMSSIARHYQNRYKLIVAFSPTGWNFGRGKKKTPGKRWKQGTMIRYEVPYSEHCSFPELREFLRFICPEDIIPSVLAKNGAGADAMIASLWSEDQ